jgi:hypothetical protein
MSDFARVDSIDVLRAFREAYVKFAEEARNALIASEIETRRGMNYVLVDRTAYWKNQLKRRTEKLSQAKLELNAKTIGQGNQEAKGVTEARENVRKAVARLQEAEAKLKSIAKWKPILEHAETEYRSLSQPLADALQGEVAQTIALLDRMIASLDAYVALAPPSTAAIVSPEGGESS